MTDRLELHLVRHGDAGDPDAWHRPDDERPLSQKGQAQAHRLADFLASVRPGIDAVITSPKVRARETAEPIASVLGVPVSLDERLGAGFGIADLAAIVADHGRPTRPLLVGHDPDFSDLASTLLDTDLRLKKGAWIRIDVDGAAGPGTGRLRWLVPPDLLAPGR